MFQNGIIYDIILIILGLSFSILSVFSTVINGVSIGYLFASEGYLNLIITYPQILLESISLIFALTGALLLTKIEIRLFSVVINRKFDEIFSRIKVPLKDLILTVVFIILLLLIGLIIGMI